MIKEDTWFLEERAFAFASLVLTRHHDVIVRPHVGTDMAVNLLAEIRKNGKSTLRFFGVQLIEYLDLPDIGRADDRVLSDVPGEHLESTLPLCVFLIGVRKPEGMYRWYVEPVVENGRSWLSRNGKSTWQPLDETGVARLIDQVNAWYDALNGNPTPKPGGRQAKTESG